MKTVTDILPLLTSGGLVGGIVSFLLLGPRLREMRVKADGDLVDQAVTLLAEVRAELVRANARVNELEHQVHQVQAELVLVRAENAELRAAS